MPISFMKIDEKTVHKWNSATYEKGSSTQPNWVYLKIQGCALAGVAQQIKHRPAN